MQDSPVGYLDSIIWWPEVLRRAWAATGDSGSHRPALRCDNPSCTEPGHGLVDVGECVPGGPAPEDVGRSCGDRTCCRCHGEYNMHAAMRRWLLRGVRRWRSPVASVLKAVEVCLLGSAAHGLKKRVRALIVPVCGRAWLAVTT